MRKVGIAGTTVLALLSALAIQSPVAAQKVSRGMSEPPAWAYAITPPPPPGVTVGGVPEVKNAKCCCVPDSMMFRFACELYCTPPEVVKYRPKSPVGVKLTLAPGPASPGKSWIRLVGFDRL